ncbi:hypothetical protein [Salinigranum rubrum]|uniref:hypothetical protein n=1 Tax=Salinigranum rubrum TaxID=755307 RepID=UPI0013A5B9B9|nr:hypothetical protein [Salinigranum rubrum]
MNQRSGRLALDIETVSPSIPNGRRPDFTDSRDFEVFAVSIGYEHASTGDIESTVLFRKGWGSNTELEVVGAALDRCISREPETILSYNGDAFDFHHLVGRARLAAKNLGAQQSLQVELTIFLDTIESDDLIHDAWSAYGQYTSLEEACNRAGFEVAETRWTEYNHGINIDELRAPRDRGTPELLSSDVALLGEIYLDQYDADETDTRQFHELEEMLRQYALSDVEPLFTLADRRPFDNPCR